MRCLRNSTARREIGQSDNVVVHLQNSCCGYNAVAAGSGDEFDESCYLITDNGANSITYEIHTVSKTCASYTSLEYQIGPLYTI